MRQAHRSDFVEEGLRIKLFHVPDPGLVPLAGQHHDAADHGRDAGRVADRLGIDFCEAFFVITDVVDVDLLALTIFQAASDHTDAGSPLGQRPQGTRVWQDCRRSTGSFV